MSEKENKEAKVYATVDLKALHKMPYFSGWGTISNVEGNDSITAEVEVAMPDIDLCLIADYLKKGDREDGGKEIDITVAGKKGTILVKQIKRIILR